MPRGMTAVIPEKPVRTMEKKGNCAFRQKVVGQMNRALKAFAKIPGLEACCFHCIWEL
jgi:hypothetical protein